MSTPLQPLTLTGGAFANGATGQLFDLTNCAPTANPRFINQNSTLVLYNESGVGLRLTGRDSGLAADLPAGGWLGLLLPVTETAINYMVMYSISAPTNTLLATYFLPNEQATVAGLGNGPLNGGSLSQASSVLQIGQPDPTSVVAATPSTSLIGAVEVLQLNNDGSATFGNTTALAHNNITFDNVGDLFASALSSKAQVTLFASFQESGVAGIGVQATASGTISIGVNFKTRMTNVPSSITLTAVTTTNITGSATAGNITVDGFLLSFSAAGAGFTRWYGTYVTVGN